MDEQAQFEKHAHDALAHLYDLPYLDEHPLARRLTPVHSSETPGRVLRRLLLEAIQDLKPPPDSPVGTWAASRYQFLYLRYVRGESVDQIARQLCLSERQLYRRRHEALEAVTATLARKLQPAPENEPPGRRPSLHQLARRPTARTSSRRSTGSARPGRRRRPTWSRYCGERWRPSAT